jgi:hypothetical protein
MRMMSYIDVDSVDLVICLQKHLLCVTPLLAGDRPSQTCLCMRLQLCYRHTSHCRIHPLVGVYEGDPVALSLRLWLRASPQDDEMWAGRAGGALWW